MVRYQLYIPKSVAKAIQRIPNPWQNRIVKALDAIAVNPFYGEKMMGKLADKRKIRVWPYRIIYRIDEKSKIVIVVEVGHRQGIYK